MTVWIPVTKRIKLSSFILLDGSILRRGMLEEFVLCNFFEQARLNSLLRSCIPMELSRRMTCGT